MSGRVSENSEEGKAIYDELMTLTKQEIANQIKQTFERGEDLPKETVDLLKKDK